MKIIIGKEEFLKVVQTVQNVVPSKTIQPILANMLIETLKDRIRLVATDLEIGISATAGVKVAEEGAITVPAKRLSDIIREMPPGEITISTKKNNMVSIESGSCVFRIMGLPKDDYPQLPDFQQKEGFTLTQPLLKDMLRMTSFAMSHDETRYVLNGINFLVKNNRVRLVATDGRRLAYIEKEAIVPKSIDKDIILSTKAVNELNRLLQDEGDINIIVDANQALFKMGNTTLITRLVEGEFPKYEQVIPKETKGKIKTDRQKLLEAIRRASLLSNPESLAIRMDISRNHVIISKHTPEVGEEREEIDVEYNGPDFAIGFNPHYLLDVLKNLDGSEIELELIDPEKPGVIRLENYIYILLPMQLT